MKKTFIAILISAMSLTVGAQESQTEYNFLKIPVSAHAAALGGDNITLTEDDPALIFQNPALLAGVSDYSLNLNYMRYMQGSNCASAAFTRTFGDKGAWAVSGQYIDYGSMKQTTEDNIQTGTFSAREVAVAGYISYMLTDRLAGGATMKLISSHIDSYNSFAVGVDLGLNYYDDERQWSLSLVAKNLGGQLKSYNDEYEKMPIDVQLGVSKGFESLPFRVHLSLVDLNHWNYSFRYHLALGADILLGNGIWVGGGYNFRRAGEMKIETGDDNASSHGAGWSFGAGIGLERFKLGLAYGKYHVSSNSLMINVTYTL